MPVLGMFLTMKEKTYRAMYRIVELKRKESKTKESMALTAISCLKPTSVRLHALYCFIYFQQFIP